MLSEEQTERGSGDPRYSRPGGQRYVVKRYGSELIMRLSMLRKNSRRRVTRGLFCGFLCLGA